ncbi:MAG TPA: HU family DNA-binding protein [Petrotogaceae bacterium]|nr:HU family DNA-binding protein [Petrotogaceae bacterium]HNV06152.1 HU family DNA-binding protein [Petrotogaceae bacterium]HOT31279.1 HU family DNA-binding protein [Petrotogaceae bacterium]HPA93098.1 HU family DNA-binding protein [Petrotogaceae bacterium]HPX15936.1 HU family DNA-binding protein [Petrotogaceae bacterium]
MNKKELVDVLSEKVGFSKKDTMEFVDSFIELVSDKLAEGEDVKLVGFGTFTVSSRKARKGVNPQTKKEIKIPARKVPKFKPGNDLKEKVHK